MINLELNAPCVCSSYWYKLGTRTSTALKKNLGIALKAFLNNAPEFSDTVTHQFNLYSKSGDINAFMYFNVIPDLTLLEYCFWKKKIRNMTVGLCVTFSFYPPFCLLNFANDLKLWHKQCWNRK